MATHVYHQNPMRIGEVRREGVKDVRLPTNSERKEWVDPCRPIPRYAS
jgi:hypothetical protein